MTKQNNSEKSTNALDEKSIDTIKIEIDLLKEFYSKTDQSIQGLFNFYLSFATALIGGSVVASQVVPAGVPINNQLIVSGLLLFIGLVGLIYNGALSNLYADLGRFAQGLDELRRCILAKSRQNLPEIYLVFINMPNSSTQTRFMSFISWFRPVGDYHFFTNVLNSTSFAVSYILFSTKSPGGNITSEILISLMIFSIVFFCQNIYARYRRFRVVSRLNVSANIYATKFYNSANEKKR